MSGHNGTMWKSRIYVIMRFQRPSSSKTCRWQSFSKTFVIKNLSLAVVFDDPHHQKLAADSRIQRPASTKTCRWQSFSTTLIIKNLSMAVVFNDLHHQKLVAGSRFQRHSSSKTCRWQ